jgi:nucleotide-binding universal stress UspA family protein
MSAIAVGFDGSSQSLEALRWALNEAALRATDVRVVAVVQGTPPLTLWGVPAPARVTEEEFADARRHVARAIEEAVDEDLRAGVQQATYEVVQADDAKDSGSRAKVRVEVVVRAGHPSAVLIGESSRSELVVVAATGMGGFVQTLMGSVSMAVVTHAHCPVTVVR